MKSARRLAPKVALAIVAPLVVFGLLEGFFRVAGLFRPPQLIVKVRHDGGRFLTTDPDYGRLFLDRSDVPAPPPLWVAAHKPPGTRRVVLLGESAAAGFPMTDHHLGRLVQARWQQRFPAEPIEVINLSMVAVNSHALREFAREAMVLDPDVFVIYAGHNEVIGPFGPAARFGPPLASPVLARWSLAVRRTHVGRVVEEFLGLFGSAPPAPGWRGLDEFRGVEVAHDDPALDTMLRHTEANFRDIVRRARRHGADVLFVLPAINLNDWPPPGSEPADEGGTDAVLAAQEAGDVTGFRSALLVYEAAQRREEAGEMARAWPLYRRAADLDLQRFRADGGVRGVQEKLAAEAGEGVAVIDACRWLHEDNPSFTSDRDYFLEHVHLTFTGRVAVAELIVDGMAALWGLAPRDGDPAAVAVWWARLPSVEGQLRRDLLFTGYDEHDMWSLAWRLLGLEVFAGAPGREQRREAFAETVRSLQRRAVVDWDTPALIAAYDFAASNNPRDPLIHFTAGRLLGLRGEGARAEQAFEAGFALHPAFADARLNHAAMQLQRGKLAEARTSLDVLRARSPNLSGLARLDAAIALRMGDKAAAIPLLEKHLRLRPDDHEARELLDRLRR